MGTEFEHKLVVVGDEGQAAVTLTSALSQAYLSAKPGMTIRVRVVDDSRAYLTIKGKQVGSAGRSTSTRYPSTTPGRCWP